MKVQRDITLALYPNSKGMGYACFEHPQHLIDHGVKHVRPMDSKQLLKRLIALLDYYKPVLVILRDYELNDKRQGRRTQLFLSRVCKLAEDLNIKVYQYSRTDIKEVFALLGAQTKYEIAHKVVEAFPELRHKLPKPRSLWDAEDPVMGLFDAMALALTHSYKTK